MEQRQKKALSRFFRWMLKAIAEAILAVIIAKMIG
jgi:hypothetical protein